MILDNVPVNLTMSAGVDFSHTYYLTNYDKSPRNIEGCEVSAYMAKHPGALTAHLSTSTEPVYNMIKLDATIVDGAGGEYSISLPSTGTKQIYEGKYVYNVVMTNPDGSSEKLVDGLIIVGMSFAALP